MKKILSFTLALTLLFSVFGVISVSASYDPSDDITSGDYRYEVLTDDTCAVTAYLGTADEVIIPSEFDGYKVTEIHRYAFAENKTITSVTVPEGVTYIGFSVFMNCTNLEELILPDSLQELWRTALKNTGVVNNLENWENGVLYIGKHLVDTNKGLSGTYTVKEGTVAISEQAFRECKNLTEVILPDSVKTIGKTAFEDCESLEKINLTDNITYIGFCAFDRCKKLRKVHIPKNIKEIGAYAFRGTAISELNLPEGLEKIDYSAFSNCDNLTSVTVPQSVTYLGDGVFSGSNGLEKITLPENLTHLGDSLLRDTAYYNNPDNWENGLLYYGNYLLDSDSDIEGKVFVKDGTTMVATRTFAFRDKISYVYLPDSVTYIGAQCFGSAEILRQVRLSKNLKTIEPYAFLNCPALESIIIPEGVTEIPMDTFFCCENLDYIRIPTSVSTIDEYSIGYIDPYYDQGDMIVEPQDYLKNENLVIAGFKGTAAEKYANDNGFKFKDLSAPVEYKYKDEILSILNIPEEDPGTGEAHLAYYSEGYEYYSSDTATPDFVLIHIATNMAYDMACYDYFGDFIMYESSGSIPYTYGYGIYTPETGEICSLITAWEQGIEGIENVFTEAGLGELAGDVNYDGKLNIRDATLIQKHLAELENLYIYAINSGYKELVPDYNRDGKLNIRDATAIQKHIAKLDIDDPDYKLPEYILPEQPEGVAEITFNGETHIVNVGDIITIGADLYCEETISKLSMDIKYDREILNALRSDTLSQSDFISQHCPNLQNVQLRYPGYGMNYDDGYINVMSAKASMDFTVEQSLCYFSFKVVKEGSTDLNMVLQFVHDSEDSSILINDNPITDIKITSDRSFTVTATR